MSTEREQLVKVISEKIDWEDDISRALDYALNLELTDKSRPRSVDVVRRVLEMGTDRNTLIATLLSDPELRGILDTKQIEQEFEPGALAGRWFGEALIDRQIKGFRDLTFYGNTNEPV